MAIESDRMGRIIKKYILPLIPNADILTKEDGDFTPRYVIESDRKASLIYLYPEASEGKRVNYRYTLGTSIPNVSVIAARFVLSEILDADNRFLSGNPTPANRKLENYLSAIYDEACILGICRFLIPEGDAPMFVFRDIMRRLSNWAARTYEGQHIPFGFIFNPNLDGDCGNAENYIEFLENENSAAFTDGVFSAIVLNKDGCISEHRQLDLSADGYVRRAQRYKLAQPSHKKRKSFQKVFAPTRFRHFAAQCDKVIGIACLSNGDLLIFKDKQIVFAWRRGVWGWYNWANINSFLFKYVNHSEKYQALAYIKSIYISILDVSFAHCGGCLAVIDMDKYLSGQSEPLKNCLLCEMPTYADSPEKQSVMRQKTRILRRLVQYNDEDASTVKFYELKDRLRLELQSLDGAMVVDKDGNIVAVGAILAVNSGSEGGGRLAAAKKMGEFGLGIKISEDGEIRAFEWNEKENKVKQVLRLI